MNIERFAVPGPLVIMPTKYADGRGFLSEVFRRDCLAAEGVRLDFVQDNHVRSTKRGVLRGLHFQIPPHAQGKLVRCSKGAILDVAVDIRFGSPTFGHHVAVELSAENWKQLWVPPGFAHGYMTLEADCDVIYKVTDYWYRDCEQGLAWDDPALGIDWGIPARELTLAEKDRVNPRLSDLEPMFRYDPGSV